MRRRGGARRESDRVSSTPSIVQPWQKISSRMGKGAFAPCLPFLFQFRRLNGGHVAGTPARPASLPTLQLTAIYFLAVLRFALRLVALRLRVAAAFLAERDRAAAGRLAEALPPRGPPI